MSRQVADAHGAVGDFQQFHGFLVQGFPVKTVKCPPELFVDVVEVDALIGQLEALCLLFSGGLESEPLNQRQAGNRHGNWRQRRVAFADLVAGPVDVKCGVQYTIEQFADSVVLGGQPGFQEPFDVFFAAGPGADDSSGLLYQPDHEPAQFILLLSGQGVAGCRILQDGTQPVFHVVQLDGTAKLLTEVVEYLALGGFQQGVVAVQQAVNDFATVMLFADDGLA